MSINDAKVSSHNGSVSSFVAPNFLSLRNKRNKNVQKRLSRKHPKTSSFGNLEVFFISVIVLLSDFLKGQLSLLCEGNSAESFTKRIGSE